MIPVMMPFNFLSVGSGSTGTALPFSDQEAEDTFPQPAMWCIHYPWEQWLCVVVSHTWTTGGRSWGLLHQSGGRIQNLK